MRKWKAAFAALVFLVNVASGSARAAPASVVPPRRLDAAEVPYPADGRGDAAVVLIAVVDETGQVTDLTVREGSPPFAAAALAVVRRWRLAPATTDGTPISARIVVTVTFHAPLPPAPPPPKGGAIPAAGPRARGRAAHRCLRKGRTRRTKHDSHSAQRDAVRRRRVRRPVQDRRGIARHGTVAERPSLLLRARIASRERRLLRRRHPDPVTLSRRPGAFHDRAGVGRFGGPLPRRLPPPAFVPPRDA